MATLLAAATSPVHCPNAPSPSVLLLLSFLTAEIMTGLSWAWACLLSVSTHYKGDTAHTFLSLPITDPALLSPRTHAGTLQTFIEQRNLALVVPSCCESSEDQHLEAYLSPSSPVSSSLSPPPFTCLREAQGNGDPPSLLQELHLKVLLSLEQCVCLMETSPYSLCPLTGLSGPDIFNSCSRSP